ncbi:hypothetical protein [Pseudomonas sp. nanlin1]|uniref:hypothetical protein n=1 Tax=Pseudomonas sp. nanlin1 TaxID=3040605 RepID=UPI00388D634C
MTRLHNEMAEPLASGFAPSGAAKYAALKHARVAILLSALVGCTSIPSQELSSVKDAKGKDINEAIAKLAPLMGRPKSVEPDRQNPENTIYLWNRYKGTFSENKYMGSTHDRSAGYLQITDQYRQNTWSEYCSVKIIADAQDTVVDYEVENCGSMDGFFGSGELTKDCFVCQLAK